MSFKLRIPLFALFRKKLAKPEQRLVISLYKYMQTNER